MSERWPNLFIVGAPKAGTTSLHDALASHADIFMSRFKEPHFFSSITAVEGGMEYIPRTTDTATYLRLFRAAGNCRLIGESSTSYMWDSSAASRIRESAGPDATIIAIIRHPAERAYSHYLNNVREGYEHRTFLDALREELDAPAATPYHLAYIGCSDYAPQIERYRSLFDERLIILQFERMVSDIAATCSELSRALGLSTPLDPSSFPKENAYSTPAGVGRHVFHSDSIRRFARRVTPSAVRQAARSVVLRPAAKPPMDPRARRILADRFSDTTELERVTGLVPAWDFSEPRDEAAGLPSEAGG